MTTAFVASDLARKRRAILDAAREGTALVRDTDGTVFAIVPASELDASRTLATLHATLRGLLATVEDESPHPTALGQAAWAASWSPERRWVLIRDLVETLALAAALDDPQPAITLLEASRPHDRATSPQFDAATAFDGLSEEDRRLLRGERRAPQPR